MDKIFSVVFIKSGMENIAECYKILKFHEIQPILLESHPEHWHFIIKTHTTEKIKAYVLTEYSYLIVNYDDDENKEDEDDENKEDENKENENKEDENNDDNDFILKTIDDYINIKTVLHKRKLLNDINRSAEQSA
jgi:hypothetical protein